MENVLYIKIDDLNVEFLLVILNQVTKQNYTYVDKIYEYVGKGFGHKTIEAELAQDLLALQDNNEDLEGLLTLYYESLLVGQDYKINDHALIHQFELLMQQARKKIEHNEEGYLENSGLKERFAVLLKRVRFETVKYPIDQIILLDQQIPFAWMYQLIRNVFKEIPFEVGTADFPTVSNIESQVALEKELILRYQNGNEFIMDVSTELQEVQTNCISFKVKFALDTHIHLSIFESWREKGIQRENNVTRYSFNLPFFYTDDIIQLTATFHPDQGYSFKVVHVDTGEEALFT